jgi:hypothetical protein
MGKVGQLFTYKELKSRTAKQGKELKRRATKILAAAADKDISRVIVVERKKRSK